MSLYDRAALARALDVAPDDLEELTADGIAHAHVRVRGRGQLVRIPRFSQVASDARAHLAYQAACFRRAAAAGVTPRLIAVLEPAPGLPMGALVVEEILGHVPLLPGDLGALAASLARLHALAVPPRGERPPVVDHADDPLAGARAHLGRQAALLDDDAVDGVLAPASRALLRDELSALTPRLDALAGVAQPASLIGFDCHPGNFLIEASGRAVLVDLERVQ
ncbi:MAG: aminoglycoside phosphotransferase, partial [Alphaproteobacteria bacterium]|nr:aminoglycoside phosphotransferase [Alphaproteobacteria bacterium]